MDPGLRDRLAGLGDVMQVQPQGGGDFAQAFIVDLTDGRRVFAKTHRDPPPGFFTTEAAGLRWLDRAGAIAVPDVLLVADDDPACLVLSWVQPGGSRSHATEAAFGDALARLHAVGAPCFGREDRRTTGSLALPNDPTADWASFYVEQRLVPLARCAADRGALPSPVLASIETVAGQIEEFGGTGEPPARLHGDLWAGNRLLDRAGRSWLIDPAAHGGHREFDLAMMRLFGGFGDAAFAAYRQRHPLADGWEQRIDLHQLAPLIVHAIKFGGGYVGAVESALARLRE
ncbi:MAG: fructosamine kinase family protein [Actinomycetota bacterium]